jgi:hypothetical protein
MKSSTDRPLLQQALRGTLFVVALTTVVCAVSLALAGLFVVVMT